MQTQIRNKLSVETLLTIIHVQGQGLGLVKVMFSEQIERLKLNFNKPSVKSLLTDDPFPLMNNHKKTGNVQHDNDRDDTTKITQEFLKTKNVKTMTWPCMSPDLNPIEHFWDH